MIKMEENGFVLPLIVLFMLVFITMTSFLVVRFTDTGMKEHLKTKWGTKYYDACKSGIERARYLLARPDDTTSAHKWAPAYSTSCYINIDNKKVLVEIEDLKIAYQ